MENRWKDLAVRTASGCAVVGVTLGAMLWSVWSYGAWLLAVLVGGMYECYRLASRMGTRPQYGMGIMTGAALVTVNFIAAAGLADGTEVIRSATLYILLLIPALFVCELFRRDRRPAANIGATLLGVAYVALPLSLLCYLPAGGGGWEPWKAVALLCIIWANDVFAYLVGTLCGRHRLCERLSPKKSWEGFFGGVAGAIAAGFVAARLLGEASGPWLGLAAVAAVAAVAGDLTESMFKRAAGVKDSGRLIPGHGGMLDRFDALLLAAPFVFVYMVLTEML